MLLNPALAELLLEAYVGKLRVLVVGVVDVVGDAVSEGSRIGEAREKGSRERDWNRKGEKYDEHR